MQNGGPYNLRNLETTIKTILLSIGGVLALLILIAGIRVGILLHNIGGYRTYWQKEAVKTPEAGALVYIALGDSAAQGIGASNPRRGYVGIVADYIAEQTGKPVRVINISVTGAKLADVIKTQLPQLATLPKADYVTIEAGANDIGGYNGAKFKNEFEILIKGLPTGTFIANMPSFNGGRKGKINPKAYSATQTINKLVGNNPDLHLADLYGTTLNQGFLDFGADLFHSSNRGYKNWARAFTDSIKQQDNDN